MKKQWRYTPEEEHKDFMYTQKYQCNDTTVAPEVEQVL